MCCGKIKKSEKIAKLNVTPLMRITDVPCLCKKCDWHGIIDECEGNVDGNGGLGCPRCGTVVIVAKIFDPRD